MSAKALFARLVSGADVNALVRKRITPHKSARPRGTPRITYTRQGTQRFRSHGGASGLSTAIYRLDCWADDFETAEDLANKVRLRLDVPKSVLQAAAWGGVTVQACFVEDADDDWTPPIHGEDEGLERVSLEVKLTYEEDVAAAT